MKPDTIPTDNIDLMAYHAKQTERPLPMRFDPLIGKVVADVSIENRDTFLSDADLQRYISVKTAIWRSISELRRGQK